MLFFGGGMVNDLKEFRLIKKEPKLDEHRRTSFY